MRPILAGKSLKKTSEGCDPTRLGSDESVAVIRQGHGLLSGLLRCGRCGKKMHVRYWGKSGTDARYLCAGDYKNGGMYCIGFGGATVDRRFSQQLLDVISPYGIEASLKAIESVNSEEDGKSVVFQLDRKSTRLNSSHDQISYAVFCLKKKKKR